MNWGALLKSKTAGLGLLLVLVGIGKVVFPDLLPWDSIIPILLGAMGVTGRDAISKIEQSGKCETKNVAPTEPRRGPSAWPHKELKMLTVSFQRPAGLDMARLRCVGVTSEVFGGHVLYFELSGTQVMYRYYASKQRWERINWVDDANKYDDKKVSGC